jgi:glyoxylase-like metal-dependent hydrolase (beta-lactamase superfamily II)
MKHALRGLLPVFALLVPVVAAAQSVGAVEKVADGVWMAPTQSGSNAGWFLVGEEVVAVDAGGDAATGKMLLDKIRETTGGKPVKYLIVTHAHADHGGGAGAFAAAGAEVICQENAAAGLAQLATPANKSKIGLLAFSERLGLFGAPRRVAVYFLGAAHTASDIFVLLPDDKILFTGDVALGKRAPFMQSPDVDPKGWENTLARLSKLDVEKIVPGHGTIGNRQSLADTYAYVKKINDLAAMLIQEKTEESMIEARLRRPDTGLGTDGAAITPEFLANIRATMRAAGAMKPSAAATPAPAKKSAPAKKK